MVMFVGRRGGGVGRGEEHLIWVRVTSIALPNVDNLAKGWIGSVGSKTQAAVVHAAKMPKRYILARQRLHVQCDGTMVDVKIMPAFASKRSLGRFNDVLHDVLEGNPDLQLVVVRPNGGGRPTTSFSGRPSLSH